MDNRRNAHKESLSNNLEEIMEAYLWDASSLGFSMPAAISIRWHISCVFA